jgi:hypothetical protein
MFKGKIRIFQRRRNGEGRMIAGETRFLSRAAGYTLWDRKRNEEIMKELHNPQTIEFTEKYRRNRKEEVGRMSAV